MVSDLMLLSNVSIRLSLNPCSNGIWSLTECVLTKEGVEYRLNPCSNGIWSLTSYVNALVRRGYVLILVLMEYGL